MARPVTFSYYVQTVVSSFFLRTHLILWRYILISTFYTALQTLIQTWLVGPPAGYIYPAAAMEISRLGGTLPKILPPRLVCWRGTQCLLVLKSSSLHTQHMLFTCVGCRQNLTATGYVTKIGVF